MKIVNDILSKRNGHYCHVLEVNNIDELINIIENMIIEFSNQYSNEEIIEFFNTIEVYCLNDENEDEVYEFDILKSINEII